MEMDLTEKSKQYQDVDNDKTQVFNAIIMHGICASDESTRTCGIHRLQMI